MPIATPVKTLDHLVRVSLDYESTLGKDELSQIADLTLRIAQARTRKAGGLLSLGQAIPFAERSETERAGLRAMVSDVVTALVLLGIIDNPG